MPFSVILFRISFSNTYYQDGHIGNDFDIVASKITSQWMAQWKVRMVTYPTYIDLVWLTENKDIPLSVFKEKLATTTLSFYMILKNPNLVNFSTLDVKGGYTYHFNNAKMTERLHIGSFVSEKDLVGQKNIANYPVRTGGNILGLIDIDLGILASTKIFLQSETPVSYKICMQAREVVVRYTIVDSNKKIKGPIKVVLGEKDAYFINTVNVATANTYSYESLKPIPLQNRYKQFFSLRTYISDGTQKTSKVLIEKLPTPSFSKLKRGGPSNKNLYNDIVVYV